MAVQELFRANKRESAVDFVVNNIKKLLVEQKLKPGDRLPNEVEISEAMNVSRGSVREALRILTAFGLVESRVGTGTYICQKGHWLILCCSASLSIIPILENYMNFAG